MDKNPIKNQWSELSHEDKREGQRKAKRHTNQRNQRTERARPYHVIGNYLTHSPSNVACMQIVRSNTPKLDLHLLSSLVPELTSLRVNHARGWS